MMNYKNKIWLNFLHINIQFYNQQGRCVQPLLTNTLHHWFHCKKIKTLPPQLLPCFQTIYFNCVHFVQQLELTHTLLLSFKMVPPSTQNRNFVRDCFKSSQLSPDCWCFTKPETSVREFPKLTQADKPENLLKDHLEKNTSNVKYSFFRNDDQR